MDVYVVNWSVSAQTLSLSLSLSLRALIKKRAGPTSRGVGSLKENDPAATAPPPPPALLTAQPQSAVAVAKKRRWMRNRLDTSALMGRVHRELQERFRRAPQGPVDGQAGHFETPCGGVLSELHGERANGRRLSATCGATRQRRKDLGLRRG